MAGRQVLNVCCGVLFAVVLRASLEPAAAQPLLSPSKGNTIVSTIFDSGNPRESLSEGYTTLETAATYCEYSEGCTLGMTIMASVVAASCQDEWAIVGLVDGISVDGSPLQNELPHSGNQQTARWQGVAKLTHGDHTASFQIYVPCSATAEQWSVKYDLTVP